MGTLADNIEEYLRRMIRIANEGMIEIRRRELAERFNCVPSQINYVLETRFTQERGYIVESRRGGGGYIRIVRLNYAPTEKDLLQNVIHRIGRRISEREAEELLAELRSAKVIHTKQEAVIRSSLYNETRNLEFPWNDTVRAILLKSLLILAVNGGD